MCSSMGGHFQNAQFVKMGVESPRPKGHTNHVYLPRPGGGILSKEQASRRMLWTPGRFSSAGVGRKGSEGSVRAAEGLL